MSGKYSVKRSFPMKKNIPAFLVFLLGTVGIPSIYANDKLFEGFSVTGSLTCSYANNVFEYIPTTRLGNEPNVNFEIHTDQFASISPGAEVSLAYNWKDRYVEISTFGMLSPKYEGTFQLNKAYKNNSSQTGAYPFSLEQYFFGGIFEAGFCSTASSWVYISTGGNAGTTYGEPRFHASIGIGPYWRIIKTDISEIDGTTTGCVLSTRYQYLIYKGLGIEATTRAFFEKPFFNRATLAAGLGAFYKIK